MAVRQPWRFVAAIAFLMAAVVGCSWLLKAQHIELARGQRLAIALVPVPFALWVVGEYVRIVRGLDEFYRRVVLEALAIAYPLAMVLGMTIEYLQKAGFLMGANVGRVWPFMALLWPLTYLYAHRRYNA